MKAQLMRFAGLGAVNTLATTLLFYLLAHWLTAGAAFSIAYLAGLAFVAVTVPPVVFAVRARASERLRLVSWYVVVYAIGLVVVNALQQAGAPRAAVVLGTVAVTAPLGFAGARFALRDAHPTRSRNHV